MKHIKFYMGVVFVGIIYASSAQAGEVINKHLPQWMNVDFQFRYRYEHNENSDFNDNNDDKKGFSLKRFRADILLKPIDDVSLFYQFQDSRIFGDSISGSKANFEDYYESRQFWFQYYSELLAIRPLLISKMGVRVGRQELSYGAQRLLGGFDWSNIAQTFDAVKLMMENSSGEFNMDVFWGEKTPNKSPREADDFFQGGAKDDFGGYYLTYKGYKNSKIEQYFLTRNTHEKTLGFGQSGDGDVEDYTIGARIVGQVLESPFDYELEGAYQFGNSGSLDVDAAMLVAILGYTFDHRWKPRLSFEYNYASGDRDSTDGDRETFDNLFPTNHLHYGYMDFASLQNLKNYRFQFTLKPVPKLELKSDLHFIFLDTANDNLYSAGRTIKRAASPGANEHVGNEIDLSVKYKCNEFVSVMAGFSHFFAGEFLEDTGSADDADYFYFQTMLQF